MSMLINRRIDDFLGSKDFDRFVKKIDIQSSGCWFWTGHNSGKGRGGGYGRFSYKGNTVAAHRWIYSKLYGRINKNHQIDHKCNNRNCVNPKHLKSVSPSVNQKLKWKRIKERANDNEQH